MKTAIIVLFLSVISFAQTLDLYNTTSTVLDTNGVFEGTSKDILTAGAGSVTVTAFTSHAGATSGFQILGSPDKVNWYVVDSTSVVDSVLTTLKYYPLLTYYKVKYTNGTDSLTTFFIQSVLHKNVVNPD